MKKFFIIVPLVVGLTACGGSSTDNETKNQLNNLANELNELGNEIEKDLDSAFNEVNKSNAAAFKPFDDVERYNTDQLNELQTFNYNDIFEYQYPEEVEFEEMQKDDHVNYSISEVHNGTIYRVEIDDYSSSDENVIDNGFTKYVHDARVEFMDGEPLQTIELKTANDETFGYYTCYKYEFEHLYKVDYVTYGKGDHLVHLEVTSRPKHEAATKVKQFIDGFQWL